LICALVNKPFIKWKNALKYFAMHSYADYHILSTLKTGMFAKIIENNTFDVATQVDFSRKTYVIENRLK
jgi:hypothetical protein